MTAAAFERIYSIIKKLRSPEGCPWDREQTPRSLRSALIEESYECIEAINEDDAEHIKEELGDVFLVVTMLTYMFEEDGVFSAASVFESLAEKLIRRHPHVFGGAHVKDSDEVLVNWARIKIEEEGRAPKDSVLDDIPQALPPLERSFKLQKKAAKAGFDWPSLEGVFAKINEEFDEVRAELEKPSSPALEGELGDLLFSIVNLCRYLNVDPSVALQRTNTKFIERFRFVEKSMRGRGIPMTNENLAVMDQYWNEAKQCHSPEVLS
ncbi:MAG: nucleoside triphosphate pyrophosphohydrolase [Spirochaetaceae bacterium]|jgi:tetrapyrrole methylase family protein/MazG family protein|nr:nucleoside triphosphate pyrophosphohydrolase [Spirochaetaceae bacterium]